VEKEKNTDDDDSSMLILDAESKNPGFLYKNVLKIPLYKFSWNVGCMANV